MLTDVRTMPVDEARAISHADEKRIARALSPAIAWPTLALAIALPAAFAFCFALGMAEIAPLWVCAAILSLVSYAHYTLVHEAVHSNVVAGVRGWTWINALVGWIGALGLGIGWPALRRTHILHHSHTNTDDDPDIFVKGAFIALLPKWVVNGVLNMIPMVFLPLLARVGGNRLRRLESIFSPGEILLNSAVTLLTYALLGAALLTGHTQQWLFLWFIPTKFGVLYLHVFFQWLPHYPFDRTDRYGATRISHWPGGGIFTLQQNLHLMHHLWPSVPFYNYPKLYRALRPVLIEEGARIEGLYAGSWRKSKV